jgi:hypothetical protein
VLRSVAGASRLVCEAVVYTSPLRKRGAAAASKSRRVSAVEDPLCCGPSLARASRLACEAVVYTSPLRKRGAAAVSKSRRVSAVEDPSAAIRRWCAAPGVCSGRLHQPVAQARGSGCIEVASGVGQLSSEILCVGITFEGTPPERAAPFLLGSLALSAASILPLRFVLEFATRRGR